MVNTKQEALKKIYNQYGVRNDLFDPNNLNENLQRGDAVTMGVNTDEYNPMGTYSDYKNTVSSIDPNAPKMLEGKGKEMSGKDKMAIASAASDLGSALAGPTKVIDPGTYSTFQAEDSMGDIKKRVLENMLMRG